MEQYLIVFVPPDVEGRARVDDCQLTEESQVGSDLSSGPAATTLGVDFTLMLVTDPWKVGVVEPVVVSRPDWTVLGRRRRNIVRLLTNILIIRSGSLSFNKDPSLECFDKLVVSLSDPATAEQALKYKQTLIHLNKKWILAVL